MSRRSFPIYWLSTNWPAPSTPSPTPVLYTAILMAVVCSLFFHGYAIFNFTLGIDEEYPLMHSTIHAIQNGRWGQALRCWILARDMTLPITPIATGLALYSTAFVLLINKLRIQHWSTVVTAAPLFFGFPVLPYIFALTIEIPDLGIGAVTAVAALYTSKRIGTIQFISSALLVAFATALYQQLLFFVIIVFIIDFVRFAWPLGPKLNKSHAIRIVWYGTIVLFGVLLYAVIEFVFLEIFDAELSWYARQTFRPDLLTANPIDILGKTLNQARKVYLGDALIFLNMNLYYRLLISVCATILLLKLYRTWKVSKVVSLLMLSLLLAILAASFFLYPFNGGELPYRTLMSIPVALASFALLASELSSRQLRLYILLPLAILTMFEFSWIANKKYYASHWSLERDKIVATQIISRITQMQPNQSTHTVVVVGTLPRKYGPVIPDSRGEPLFPSSTLGASFFEFHGWLGDQSRVAAFLNFMTDAQFRPATPDQLPRAFEAAGAMPSWPAAGAVAQVGDMFVVKFSDVGEDELKYQQWRLSLDLSAR
jgi:hypothetical protein